MKLSACIVVRKKELQQELGKEGWYFINYRSIEEAVLFRR